MAALELGCSCPALSTGFFAMKDSMAVMRKQFENCS